MMSRCILRRGLIILTCLFCFCLFNSAVARETDIRAQNESPIARDESPIAGDESPIAGDNSQENNAQLESVLKSPREALPLDLGAQSVLLMEPATGTVIFEHNADMKRPIASINKVMTLLLVMEAFDEGIIAKDTPVTVSEHAMGMGGSQALLDAGSTYSAGDLLMSVIVASANDSSVALAEHLYGSESAFVDKMNERAADLGMTNTVFTNCTGLPCEQGAHYSTAADIAIMSRELIKHPLFFEYSSIWLTSIEHAGGRKTELSNTNRLIRFYNGADGVKTGSTDEAKYCISATAERGGMRLLAVVLGSPTGTIRFDDAKKMLDYGFAHYQLVKVGKKGEVAIEGVPVKNGELDKVDLVYGDDFALLLKKGQEKELSYATELATELKAPLDANQSVGKLEISLSGTLVKSLDIVTAERVGKPGFLTGLSIVLKRWFWR